MCKFCKNSFTGDANDDLIEKKSIKFNGIEVMGVSVWIDDNILNLYLDNIQGFSIGLGKRKIKYCPMCGRKLEK